MTSSISLSPVEHKEHSNCENNSTVPHVSINARWLFLVSVHYSVLVDVLRPHWEKCGQYVEGGTDRWNELSQDRSSDELVDILLAEMTGQDIAIIQAGVNTGAEYFTGQVYNLKYFVGRAHRQISSSPGLQVGHVTS